jgi:hypothetical protein
MNERTVSMARLAREMGLERTRIKHFVKHRKLGKCVGARCGSGRRAIMFTEAEAEVIRRELGERLVLPTVEDLERRLGERVWSTVDAAKSLGLHLKTIQFYGHELGVLHQIRNGLFPTYVVSASGMQAIWEAQQETQERLKQMLRDQAQRAAQIGGRRSQHQRLMQEETDYYGRVKAFEIQPVRSRTRSYRPRSGASPTIVST